MELLNFLFGSGETRNAPSDASDRWFSNPGSSGVFGQAFDDQSAYSITAIYACVRVLAESIASLPVFLYERLEAGGKKKATGNPLWRVITRQPNPWQTRFEFWEMLMGHLCLRGNAYALKVDNQLGDLLMLVPLDPTRMRVSQAADGAITYEYRLKSGITKLYGQEDIMHVRGLSSDGLVGLSPIQLLQRPFSYALAADEYATAFFQNFTQMGIVLKHPNTLTPEARKNLKQSINEAHMGSRKAFKTLVLEEGLTMDEIGMPLKDLQFVEARKMQVTEIARAFRVPPHMIGDLERATFSNIEQQSIDFVTNTLRPWAVRIELAITRDLIPEEEKDKVFAEFSMNALLRGDIAARSEAYVKALTNGWLNPDEVREYENLNPIPDGSGQVYRVQLNTTPSDSVAAKTGDPKALPTNPKKKEAKPTRELHAPLSAVFRGIFEENYGRVVRKHIKIGLTSPQKLTAEQQRDDITIGCGAVMRSMVQYALRTAGQEPDATTELRFVDILLDLDRLVPSADGSDLKTAAVWDRINAELNKFVEEKAK